MKHSKKIFALVTVLVLVLSLSTMAYAASSAYTYSVVPRVYLFDAEDVSLAQLEHDVELATNIRYSFEARIHTFDQTQFNSTHLSGLMQAYRDAGLQSPMRIPATSGTQRVPAWEPSGLYGVLLFTYYADGNWNVYIGNTPTSSGTFQNAPHSYSIDYFAFELDEETA